jgi:hypothetical protein
MTENALGQEGLKVPVNMHQAVGSTRYFLEELTAQTGYVFSYSNKLCFKEELKCPFGDTSLLIVLNWLFDNCPAKYIVRGQKVIIEPIGEAPPRYTISGFIRDHQQQEVLIGANVYEAELYLGSTSNNFGFYSLSLPAGYTYLNTSYVGYRTNQQFFELTKDTVVNIYLEPKLELDEVEVVGSRVPSKIRSTRTGTVDVPMEQIRKVPVFFGEVDIVKSLQLLPGVQSGGEGFSGLYVRGGGPDQNLVMLDDVPVYNVGHLLGFFSIFNADAVNKVSIVKGGFPARFGGRLSSVVDIRTFDGNPETIKGSASVGVLSSRVALNGPVIKDKATFSVSFRRTYYDLLVAPFQANKEEKSNYYFFDLNGKFTYKFSEKDKLYLSSYWGKDEYYTKYNFQDIAIGYYPGSPDQRVVSINDESNSGWRNIVGAARWNHVFGNKLFSNVTAVYSDYRFFMGQRQNYYLDAKWSMLYQRYFSGIRDLGLKVDFDYMPNPGHYIRYGGSAVQHAFYPGIDVLRSDIEGLAPEDTTLGGEFLNRSEYRMYVEDDFFIFDRLKLNIGVHVSLFLSQSKNYSSIEPRVSGRYLVSDQVSFKAAYSEMSQYIHLLRTANVALPTDMWLPVSDNIEPMRAKQSALGVEWAIKRGINLSVEAYYKTFSNLLAYKDKASFFDLSQEWEEKLATGDGDSYGLEVLLHKKSGDLSGWFGYTHSRTFNWFNDLNQGKAFPANTDRRHDASMFLSYKFNKQVDGGVTWLFGTGSPITLPSDKYYAPSLPTEQPYEGKGYNHLISERNGYRMPNFHRMDVGFNFKKDKSWGTRMWSVGVINLYGRQNPFFLYFEDQVDEKTEELSRSLKQFSLFPFPMPYVRYTINF